MMKTSLSLLMTALLATAGTTSAVELSPDNWDELTAGKTVFLKFFAPWCGHCKKLKPDWDKLMDEFADSPSALVGDVDCTADGKPLCDANGVKGYPTLKWGDPSNLEDYKGARSFGELKKFAEDNLKPMCSPSNIDLCDADKKKEIEKFQAMSDADLDAAIKEKDEELAKAEEDFKAFVEDLQSKYQEGMKAKDDKIERVKDEGLGLMKAVKAAKGKKDGAKAEL